ncbi:TPA: hypothetical protein KZI03_000600 [Listeria monocytogenes]|nr:hypothetical protein [Listeria monocytogenes]HBI2193240.1 hypothetical protein [Listeria monocytogenes]
MELFRLLGTIAIDNQKANSEIDETTGKAEKSEGKMSAAFKKIGKAVVTAFAVQQIVDFGKKCVEVAAEVKAVNSQFEQTFGDMQQAASDAIKRVSDESGILETRLKGIGTSIYAFAKTTGMDSSDALDMMEESLQVAADSAAYYDRSLEDTTENLKSFLKGNFENDAALGLSCTETTRNAAANKLYGKSFIELSESQKQLTLLQMVKDANELSGAMGQAARESDGWENVLGNLKESMKQLMATIGTPILSAAIPVVKALATGFEWLNTKVGEAIAGFGDTGLGRALKEFAEVIVPILQAAYDNIIKPVFDAIVSVISDIVVPAFEALVLTITGMVKTAEEKFGFIQPLIEGAMKNIQLIISAISALIRGDWEGFWDAIVGIVKNTGSALFKAGKAIFQSLFDGLKSVWTSISSWVESKVGWIVDKLNMVKGVLSSIKSAVSEAASAAVSAITGGGSDGNAKVKAHAAGGILTKPTIFGYTPSTNTYHLGGEAGAEAIAPIDKLQGYVKKAVSDVMKENSNDKVVNLLEQMVELLARNSDVKLEISGREFGRMVKEYA